jgi:hypothetical protein
MEFKFRNGQKLFFCSFSVQKKIAGKTRHEMLISCKNYPTCRRIILIGTPFQSIHGMQQCIQPIPSFAKLKLVRQSLQLKKCI